MSQFVNRGVRRFRRPSGPPAVRRARPRPRRDGSAHQRSLRAHPRFDDEVHQPVRLEILALLAHLPPGHAAPFRDIRDHLDLTSPNLSYHLERLETVEYVQLQILTAGRIRHTLVSITPAGRRAFDGHLGALARLVGPHGFHVGPPWVAPW